jgi:flagellar hook assembly protein FlgD
LHPNVPNPFNPRTRIAFEVEHADVTMFLRIYDVLGRQVRTLVAGRRSVGPQSVEWDGRDDSGRDLASGIYVAQLQAAEHRQTQRLVLIR